MKNLPVKGGRGEGMLASPSVGARYPGQGDASIPSPRPLLPRPYATQK